MTSNARIHSILTRLAAATAAVALGIGLAACGSDSSSDASASASASSTSAELPKLEGVTASGKLGEKPEVSFKAPLSAENNAAAVLQEGDGDDLVNGNRICMQLTQYGLTSGEEVATTWTDDVPDCSLILDEDNLPGDASSATLGQIANQMLSGKKINTTFAVTINDGNDEDQSYMLVATATSQSKDYEVAQGKTVTPPSDLPKVTIGDDGKPSIDMNGYKGSDELVSQTLIEGEGPEVTDSAYGVVVNYSGWLLDGTQFDSSWERGQTYDAVLQNMIQGWQEGLVGHTVGSRVLLVIPPDLGYGDEDNGEIPANSTLVFVVDILGKY